MLKWSNLPLISLSSRSRTDPRRIFRALLPGRNWLVSLYSKWVKLFSLEVLIQNQGHEISYSRLNQVHMFTKFVKGQGTHKSKAPFIWRQVVPGKRDTRLPARGTLRELDCKTVGFFSKSVNKSVKRGKSLTRAKSASLTRPSCEAREKKPSLPSLTLHFQPCSRPLVWLLALTWKRKNTDCFAVYKRANF